MLDDHPLDHIETTQRSLTRAETESFDFRLHQGDVLVTNLSHDDPSEHEYRVTIRDGVPVDCTCPAEAHYAPACKHRVGVAMRSPVVEAAARMQVAADGGRIEHDVAAPAPDGDQAGSSDDCDCDGLPDGVPCWPCYRDGEAAFED